MSPFVFKPQDGERVWQEGGKGRDSCPPRENVMIVRHSGGRAAAVGPYQLIFGGFVPLFSP